MVNSLLQCFGAFYDVHKGAHCIDSQLPVGDPEEGPGEPSPPLFLDQTEAQRVEKKFFETGPPPLSHGLDDRPPPLLPLSVGLDPPLVIFKVKTMLCSTWTTSFACGCCNSLRSGIAKYVISPGTILNFSFMTSFAERLQPPSSERQSQAIMNHFIPFFSSININKYQRILFPG